jgi:hypothetical protein
LAWCQAIFGLVKNIFSPVDIGPRLVKNGSMNPIQTIEEKLFAMSRVGREIVASESGVPLDTVQKIAIGATRNPRFDTAKRLIDYFGMATWKKPK